MEAGWVDMVFAISGGIMCNYCSLARRTGFFGAGQPRQPRARLRAPSMCRTGKGL
ncbi:hypothetical protein L506_4759 [Bordetella bronchiseptica GA96-01]|nr:hypothetical protein AZ18_4814 [Bordetella bronchiseptica D993]KDC34515.1 hypothetical protein L506_4759 [Bordetella bronchiseptica GA96-01]